MRTTQREPLAESAAAAKQVEATRREFISWVAALPSPSPAEMYTHLEDELGFIGQESARRAVCLMAYRHLARIRHLYLDKVPAAELPPKENLLLMGPTGCGKTYLVELLFRELLGVPTVVIDTTSLTETGYVGGDAASVLTRLIGSAQGNAWRAATGIIALDEFDKLASCGNTAVFAGQGTTKDVSGLGVQKELLKMLEDAVIPVPREHSQRGLATGADFSTRDIAFIACGAFSGLDRGYQRRDYRCSTVGFAPAIETPGHSPQASLPPGAGSPATLEGYGFMPELVGRFSRVIPFAPLGARELGRILERNLLGRYQRELAMAGIELRVSPGALEMAVRECLDRGSGARGLRNVLNEHLESGCFKAYSAAGKARAIDLFVRRGRVQCRVR